MQLLKPVEKMSSREIAELTGKEHKNVLRVIRDLIDDQILDAQIEPLKFEYRGQWFDYYDLNKRDSLVVVARLSPEFTAAVIDRWQELETGLIAIKDSIETTLTPFKAAKEYAELFGLVGNQALLSANMYIVSAHNFNPMQALGITHLDKKDQAHDLTPTQIGKDLGLSAIKTNKLLESKGYQDLVGNKWQPTELGKPYAVFKDTGKKKDGAPITQLVWLSTIVALLK